MVPLQLNHGLNNQHQHQQQHHITSYDQSNIDIYTDSATHVTKQGVCLFQLGNTDEDKAGIKVAEELFKIDKKFVVGDNTIVYERINGKWKKDVDVERLGAAALEQALINTATQYFQSKCKNQPILASGHSNGNGIGVTVQWKARNKKDGPVLAQGESRIRYPYDSWRLTSDSKPLYIASCMCNGVTGGTIKFCENRVVNPVQFKNGKYGWTSVVSRQGDAVMTVLGGFPGGKPAVVTDTKWIQIKQLDNTAKFITFDNDGNIQTE